MAHLSRLILLLAAGFLVFNVSGAASRPNILFVFSDDHSLQTIGAYNAPVYAQTVAKLKVELTRLRTKFKDNSDREIPTSP